jgi:hypothetical protein
VIVAIVFRLAMLAIGLGATEIGLSLAFTPDSIAGWALVLLIGLPLIVAGSASFIAPLLGASRQKGQTNA